MKRAVFAIGLAGSTALACQLLAPSDAVQCTSDKDCTARGGEFADTVCKQEVCSTPGSCYGSVEWVQPDPAIPIKQKVRTVSVALRPVQGVEVLACSEIDPTCLSPLSRATSDAQGNLDITTYYGFRGSVQVRKEPPGFEGDFFPFAAYLYPPPVNDDLGEVPSLSNTRLSRRSEVDALFKSAGLTREPGLGILYIQALDCNERPARGLGVTMSNPGPLTRTIYINDNSIASLSLSETSTAGVVAFVNVPPGGHRIEGRSKNGIHGAIDVSVEADFLTFVLFAPTP